MLFITCYKDGYTVEVNLSEVLYVSQSPDGASYIAHLKNGQTFEVDPAPFGSCWIDAIYKVRGRNK
jgi:hypothetical protein